MSRIVVDARTLGSSTGRHVERMLHYLQLIDHDNEYVVLLTAQDAKNWKTTAPNFRVVVADFSMYGIDGQIGLAQMLYGLKPDLVHFTFQQTAIPYNGKNIVSILDLTQLKFDNVKEGSLLSYKIKQKILALGVKIAAKKANKIITISDYVRSDIVANLGVPNKKIVVTKLGADTATATPLSEPYPSLDKKEYILYTGRAFVHKNLDRLVEAFMSIADNHPHLHLVLVGKTDFFYERLARKVKDIPDTSVRDRIILTGFVSDAQLNWLYEHALAYVSPSLSEGFGMPGLEAMQFGLPIISSDATCSPEIYEDAAVYFDGLDVQNMATVIARVVDEPQLRKEQSKKSKLQVKKYSWERCAKETLAVYQELLGKKN